MDNPENMQSKKKTNILEAAINKATPDYFPGEESKGWE